MRYVDQRKLRFRVAERDGSGGAPQDLEWGGFLFGTNSTLCINSSELGPNSVKHSTHISKFKASPQRTLIQICQYMASRS